MLSACLNTIIIINKLFYNTYIIKCTVLSLSNFINSSSRMPCVFSCSLLTVVSNLHIGISLNVFIIHCCCFMRCDWSTACR